MNGLLAMLLLLCLFILYLFFLRQPGPVRFKDDLLVTCRFYQRRRDG